MNVTAPPAETRELRKAGLKVTLPRVKILQLLEQAEADNHHLSAEAVYKQLQQSGDEIGLATVYRVLTQFEAAGLVARHHFESGHSVFELAQPEHHDHMLRIDTGQIIEFSDNVIEKRQRQLAAEHGYELINHSLVMFVRPK